MLDGAGDADGKVELGRDGLAGAADLALDGKPAVVADGTGCGEFCAECGGEVLDERKIVCSLMPRPTATMMAAEPRSTVWAAPRKGSSGLVRMAVASSGVKRYHLRRAGFELLRRERRRTARRGKRGRAGVSVVRVRWPCMSWRMKTRLSPSLRMLTSPISTWPKRAARRARSRAPGRCAERQYSWGRACE